MSNICDPVDILSNSENCIDINSINILCELVLILFIFEDGYFRFDFWDEENFDKDLHPLHHIDFYYTNANTFKLAISDEMTMKEIIEIVDIRQKCSNITSK